MIVGAGPTGLGAAWALRENGIDSWRILERANQSGGLAGSVTDDAGFTWDLGGHVNFSSSALFNEVLDSAMSDSQWCVHERCASVSIDGSVVGFPLQQHVDDLPLELAERIRAELAAGSAPSSAGNFGEWCRTQFGASLTEHFFRPYNEKLWRRDLEQLNTKWVEDRVAPPKQSTRAWGPNRSFRYPAFGGNGEPWRRLASELGGDEAICYGSDVVEVNTEYRFVTLSDGTQVEFDFLLSTVPLDQFVAILRPQDPELVSLASGLERTSTHLVGLRCQGNPPAELSDLHWRYFADAQTPFYRATVLSNYARSNAPEGFWSILTETASRPSATEAPKPREVVEAGVREHLIEHPGCVQGVWEKSLEYGYPIPTRTRDVLLSQLQDALQTQRIYSRGRFGGWKYEVSNQDHSFLQGVEVARSLLGLGAETTYRHAMDVSYRRC